MAKKEKGLLLQTVKQMNMGSIVSGIGFLLYLAARAMGRETAADIIVLAFAVVSAWTFLSVASARQKDQESVSYNLLWGSGALALMLAACALLTVRARLGL